MNRHRTRVDAGYADRKKLPRGPNGNVLCRWCNKETDSPRKNFCGPPCVHEWRMRSNSSYARSCVRKRDKGICAVCRVDTYEVSLGLRKPLKDETKEAWKARIKATRKKFEIPAHRMTWWDADHIVPVVEGGGSCGLENLRTLCVPCHKKATAELRARLSSKK